MLVFKLVKWSENGISWWNRNRGIFELRTQQIAWRTWCHLKKKLLSGRPLTISIVSIRNSVKADREKWAFTGLRTKQVFRVYRRTRNERTNEPNLTISAGAWPAERLYADPNTMRSNSCLSHTTVPDECFKFSFAYRESREGTDPSKNPAGTKQQRPQGFCFSTGVFQSACPVSSGTDVVFRPRDKPGIRR